MGSNSGQGEAGFKLPLRLDETTGQVVDANDMLVYETAGRFYELTENVDDNPKWEYMPGERESTERLLRMVNSQPSLLAACKAMLDGWKRAENEGYLDCGGGEYPGWMDELERSAYAAIAQAEGGA